MTQKFAIRIHTPEGATYFTALDTGEPKPFPSREKAEDTAARFEFCNDAGHHYEVVDYPETNT